MTEKELGEALLKRDDMEAAAQNAHSQASKVLRRHKRWVSLLTGLTVFFWLLAAAGVLVVYFGFITFMLPRMSSMLTHPSEVSNDAGWRSVVRLLVEVGTPVVVSSVVAMVLAALCTVLLVFTSRRVTLRQISLNLAEISQQLARMRTGSGGA